MVIEGVMLALVGALAATLLWLLVLPGLSRRAARRAEARVRAEMPMSLAEINADRDQLRAGHALAQRALERRIEDAAERVAGLMGESGRRAARIVTLDAEAAAARDTIGTLGSELAAMTRGRREAEATLGTQVQALHDTTVLAERRFDLLNATRARLDLLEAIAEERAASIAALEAHRGAEEMRLRAALSRVAALTDEDRTLRRTLEATMTESRKATEALDIAGAERDALRRRVDDLGVALAALGREADALRSALGDAETRLSAKDAVVEGLSRQVAVEQQGRDAVQRRLDAAERRPPETTAAPAGSAASLPGGKAGEDRAAQLRAAVATLAADLVAFAGAEEATPPAGIGGGA